MGAYCLKGLHACWVRASRLFGVCGLIHFAGVDIRWIRLRKACGATGLTPGMQRPFRRRPMSIQVAAFRSDYGGQADSAPRPFSGPFTRNILICYLLSAIREAPLASMRRRQILNRAEGYDPGRVDIVMGIVVVPLDMIEINGFSDSWLLI